MDLDKVRACVHCGGLSGRGVTGHQVIHPAGSQTHPRDPRVTHVKHSRMFHWRKKKIYIFFCLSCYLEFRLKFEPSVVTVSIESRLFAVKLLDTGKYFFSNLKAVFLLYATYMETWKTIGQPVCTFIWTFDCHLNQTAVAPPAIQQVRGCAITSSAIFELAILKYDCVEGSTLPASSRLLLIFFSLLAPREDDEEERRKKSGWLWNPCSSMTDWKWLSEGVNVDE